jgi:hypothetical protein
MTPSSPVEFSPDIFKVQLSFLVLSDTNIDIVAGDLDFWSAYSLKSARQPNIGRVPFE